MAAPVGVGSPVAGTVVIQPDRLCREGLTRILREFSEVRLIASAATASEARSVIEAQGPEVVLTEIDLPDDDGLRLITDLAQRPDPTQVIVLSRQAGHAYVSAALGCGARGYLLRSSSPEELRQAIHTVVGGQTFVQPALAAGLVGRRIGAGRESALTDRESVCLIHLARGATNQEIAKALYLGEKTVRNTLTRLFQKLKARNRTEAVARGREAGYL